MAAVNIISLAVSVVWGIEVTFRYRRTLKMDQGWVRTY